MSKNKLLKILLIVFILFIPRNIQAVNEDEIIIIGGEENYPPFAYVDVDGEYRGFNVDLMRALSIEMGIEIKLLPMDWVEYHTSLQNGEIHAIHGMNYNKSREEMYEFSDEFLKNSLVAFVRKNDTEIFGIDNLRNKKVAVQRNDFASHALAELGEVEVIFFTELDEGFEKLLKNEVDAVVGNKHTGLYILEENKNNKLIKTVGNDIKFTSYGMAFKKGNTELADEFNEGIKTLKKNGTYYKLYEKWFGKEDEPPWKNMLYILYILIVIIIIILLVILFFVKINSLLRREIKKRTADLENLNLELKDSQQEIKESDKYKEEVLNSIGNGLVTFDKEGYITTVNKGCERLLGINTRNFIGKKYDEVNIDKYINIEHLEKCLRYEKEFVLIDKTYFKDNQKNIISYILKPMFDLNNIHIGAVVTFNDITEITQLRDKLAENNKMTSLGTLVSRISHEIRNPLTSIKAYVDLLPLKYDNIKFRQKITTEIPYEIERLNNLLTELIDYSKPKKLLKETFDITHLLEQTIDLLSPEISAKSANIILKENNSMIVYADMQQVKQIIMNIIKNSLDSLEDNGTIRVTLEANENNIILDIHDNGHGISDNDLDTIFDPFFTTKAHGTGLGLAISHQLARENNITIDIDSKYSKYTNVKLVFLKS